MKRLRSARMLLLVCCLHAASCVVYTLRAEEAGGKMPAQFQVVVEKVIGTYENPNNGAGPMWCYGSPTIVRDGSRVFASLPETGSNARRYCNTRWQLLCREDGGKWECVNVNSKFDEREPCPLVRLPGGRILLSVNPKVSLRGFSRDGAESCNCKPHLLEFAASGPRSAPRQLLPRWDKEYEFTEHSYRGVAADGRSGEVLLLNVLFYSGQAWSYLDKSGNWSRQGFLRFPVRGAYPQVALRNGAAYVMAVSDVVEPNPVWRAFKKKVTGRDWDYEFRQLFFSYTPDLAKEDFSPPLTIATRDETAGHIRNLDMWVDSAGDAHVIYIDRNIWHTSMRDEFFPGTPITVALKYCRLREGKAVERRTLVEWTEGQEQQVQSEKPWPIRGMQPHYAAFHSTANGWLYVVCYMSGKGPAGEDATGDYVFRLVPASDEPPVRLKLKYPLTSFFAANERTGTAPSDVVDLYGTGPEANTIRYAQLRLER